MSIFTYFLMIEDYYSYRQMKTISMFIFLALAVLNVNADQCQWVNEHCPLYGGYTSPKCRIDDEYCSEGICWRYVCTYCNARLLGCSVDLAGGVPGTIVGV